ncbi:MAG: aminopeptidase P family N-terminal domain-containing protein [Bacteroidales bacterium]|nr:aminopeptidase P family N-terminal domain-containing protein [Bacteroidales bacterium]
MSEAKDKLKAIREQMGEKGIDAYIIPVTDPHLGEYVPDHWRIVRWLTGFTGSAANVLITSDFAGLWTDSRYFVQAEAQLSGSGFELVKLKVPHTPEYIDWLVENMPAGTKIAADGRIMPLGTVKMMEKAFSRKKINLDTEFDLISGIWHNRVPMPEAEAFEHHIRFAGKSRKDKIKETRSVMKTMDTDYHLLTSLDDIAWLLNIRGGDVDYSPLFTAFALLGSDELFLFAPVNKIPGSLQKKLNNDGVIIKPYESLGDKLGRLEEGKGILLTPGTTSASVFKSIPEGLDIIEEVSIPTRMKALKNDVETENIRQVMIKDGVAMTKFFYWLENSIGKEKITEISAADKLLELRMEQEDCAGPSFATIAGYNEHGALPHYCSTPETDVELKPEGIFLLDSGGQYYGGTTDITRTICLGEPTAQAEEGFYPGPERYNKPGHGKVSAGDQRLPDRDAGKEGTVGKRT